MIHTALNHDMAIMVGCMTETSIGISHAAQLLHLAQWADLDGSTLIKNDPASGVSLCQGVVIAPRKLGSGAELKALVA